MSDANGHGPLLELEGVEKHFGGVVALSGATASLRPGRVMGLIGNNGAGKSTLVRIVSGVLQPDHGTLKWRNEEIRLKSPRQARQLGIDTVYQELALADDLDAAANVFLNRELSRGWGPFRVNRTRAMRSEAAKLFSRFSIRVPMDREVRQMSGGQRQGVAIARALLGGSTLLVMDEPTAALGPAETAQVEDLIMRLREHGVAILLVSHNVDQVLKLCDELCVLRRGEMVGVYERGNLTPSDIVSLIVGADS